MVLFFIYWVKTISPVSYWGILVKKNWMINTVYSYKFYRISKIITSILKSLQNKSAKFRMPIQNSQITTNCISPNQIWCVRTQFNFYICSLAQQSIALEYCRMRVCYILCSTLNLFNKVITSFITELWYRTHKKPALFYFTR